MLLPGGGHGAQGRGAEGLGTQGEVLHQQVVLQVGLMGRGAGLHQELSHVAVELGEHHRVPVVDHLNQVGGLALGLVGGVPVQIEAVVVAAGVVGAPVGVLVGADDKDDVVQDVVHVQRDVLADGVELAGVVDAGVVLDVALGIGGELLGAQSGDAQINHVGGKHGGDVHALVQEAGEGVVGDGLLGGQGPQHVELGVHAGILIGVHVVQEEGHPVLAHGAGLQLGLEGGGVGLGDGVHLLEGVHRLLAVGEGHIVLIPAALALAEGGDGDVPAGQGIVDNLLNGLVHVVIAGIAVIGVDNHVRLSDHRVAVPHRQGIGADEAGPGVAVAGGFIVDPRKGCGGKGLCHSDGVPLLDGAELSQGKQSLTAGTVVPDLPVVQPVAGVVIGVDIRILESLVPGEIPGQTGNPLRYLDAIQDGGIHGQRCGKFLILIHQGEGGIRNRQRRRCILRAHGRGNGAQGEQHTQCEEKGAEPGKALRPQCHG